MSGSVRSIPDTESLRFTPQPQDIPSRPSTPSHSAASGYPHSAAHSGFNSRLLSDLITNFFGSRAGSRPASSAHLPNQGGAGINLNAIMRMVRSIRTEVDNLRQGFQTFQTAGGNAATQGRPENPEMMRTLRRMQTQLDNLQQRVETTGGNAATQDRQVTEEQLRQEARDLQLATKMQELEDQHEKAALNRKMSQAISGYEVAKNGFKAVENITR